MCLYHSFVVLNARIM